MMLDRLRASDGQSERLLPPLQRIIAIGVAVCEGEHMQTRCLGNADNRAEPSDNMEVELLQSLFKLLPGQMLIWDDADRAALNYRSLYHNLAAPAYWQHLPLALQNQLSPQAVPLQDMARLFELPQHTEIPADKIWQTWLDGGLDTIRAYSANKALQTCLLFLRWQQCRGELSAQAYQTVLSQVAGG
jgi:predicted PolB exonuclease-like 3'-5' exonuclease